MPLPIELQDLLDEDAWLEDDDPSDEHAAKRAADAALAFLVLLGARLESVDEAQLERIASGEIGISRTAAEIIVADIAERILKTAKAEIAAGRLTEDLKPAQEGPKSGLGGVNPAGTTQDTSTTLEAVISAGFQSYSPTVAFQQAALGAYAAGRYDRQQSDPEIELLEYLTMQDSRVRPSHAPLNGIVLPKDHPWWDKNYPPNGYNCRCIAEPAKPGATVTPDNQLRDGFDGAVWAFNPLKEPERLEELLTGRIASLHEGI